MSLTIGETVQQLHRSLRDYIEAAYHIGHPFLVAQRRTLLDEVGVIHQRPYLESTPRYKAGVPFEEAGLDPSVLEIFKAVTTSGLNQQSILINDPPYKHQEESIRLSSSGKSLIVIT